MRRSAPEGAAGALAGILLAASALGMAGAPQQGVAGWQQAEARPSPDMAPAEEDDAYLSWSREEATEVGKRMRAEGRAGNLFDTRIRHTERSYKYKLRVTWLTPEVIRATARLAQIEQYLTDRETRALVEEAEAIAGTVMLVEIDPSEGSGVIPLNWLALLRPLGLEEASGIARGTPEPRLRRVRALQGVMERDYAYDIFWVVFPLVTEAGNPLFPEDVRQAELIVRIHDKEERVTWPIPSSIRDRAREAGRG